MPKKFSHHFKEGFSKHARKISDHVTWRGFQMMPERSCQEGFFKWSQKDFSDYVKKGFSNYARKISQIMSRRGFSNYARNIFQIKSRKGFQIVPERFFQIMSRRVFQIMPERFFRSSQRRGFQIMPERFFRSSEESSDKLVKSADLMCMMEQILVSWVVSDHVCFVTFGFCNNVQKLCFWFVFFNGLLLIRPSEIVLQICPTFLQLSQYTTSRLISCSSSSSSNS